MSQVYQMYPPKCYKTPEHLFRLSPRQTLFRSCRGLFRGTFCNFVARNVGGFFVGLSVTLWLGMTKSIVK